MARFYCRALLGLLILATSVPLSNQAAEASAASETSRIRTTPGLVFDRSALLALQSSLSSYGRSRIAVWKTRGDPCFPKPWPHLTCSAGRVVTLDLSNLDIVGTLPNKLRYLNYLTHLNFANNRFSGAVPSGWAHPAYFRNIKSINLANNLLTGNLPNRTWNIRKAFRSLETLILSQNRLIGGLPDGWMSTASILSKLKLLDLSDNRLGYSSSGAMMAPYTSGSSYGWCLQGRTVDSGWCPTVLRARATSMEILDLSENDFAGQLPFQWAQLFPSLQYLLIQRNMFYSVINQPGSLPDAWTRRTVPRAFRQLVSLVLYPGNNNICSVPKLDDNLFCDINEARTYLVESDSGTEYDSENPWFCYGPETDNPPRDVAVTISTTLVLGWKGPSGEMDQLVFGYRFTLTNLNQRQELVPGWTARTLKVYGGNSPGLIGDPSGYTLDTFISGGAQDTYKLEISTLNMDGIESTTATAYSRTP